MSKDNSLIESLREAKTLAVADPILKQLGANSVEMKLVEASILQRMSPNPASYEYGVGMLNTVIRKLDPVIRELEPEEEPAEPESPGLKIKDDHFVKEEELANGNTGERNVGSEQSTENTEPYSGEGTKTGDEDMINAPDTENQMSEMQTPFPDIIVSKEMGGLHPDIAKGMGSQMPKIPPMNPADQMKQTRYTISQYHETIVKPLVTHMKKQDAAIKILSQKVKETEAKAGTYSLDMDIIKSNAPARLRETVASNSTPANISGPQELSAFTQKQNKNFDLHQARQEILEANNQMSN